MRIYTPKVEENSTIAYVCELHTLESRPAKLGHAPEKSSRAMFGTQRLAGQSDLLAPNHFWIKSTQLTVGHWTLSSNISLSPAIIQALLDMMSGNKSGIFTQAADHHIQFFPSRGNIINAVAFSKL